MSQNEDYGMFKTVFTEIQMIGEDKYSLDIGAPGVKILRSAATFLLKATEMRLEREISGDGDLLQYGSRMGDPDYRTNLAKFLSEEYDDNVDPKSLFTTSGATSGLSLLASTFFSSGDYIFTEDPTFYLVNGIVSIDLGLKTVPIPLDDNGINLETLEQEIKRRKPDAFQPTAKRPFWALLYVITIYQNPTGLCYSKEKCEKLVKIARDYNMLVISDDVYNLLCFEKDGDDFKRAPPRLYQYDVKSDKDYFGNIVSNGSFSKLLGPGLRLGWIEAPTVVLNKLMMNGCLSSSGCLNHYTSGIVGSSLNTDLFNNYLLMVRNTGKEKLDAVTEVLQKHCPKNVKYKIPKGGYFIWIELPSFVDTQELNEDCKRFHNISCNPGILCSISGGYHNCLRICFMYYSPEELRNAIKKLLETIKLRLKRAADNNEVIK
ncbi:uncharacterized protein YER152C-like isoform X2 [Anneissia japonica]|uniref:uncharacterized protein YER152C-like isoform X2 n=1 Tax=Anneissia japonica TaxID=1529436 RepID=UPI0014257E19|nr:uncharacterized protein YER152C-like isoform X2 [Anneissia japonica]